MRFILLCLGFFLFLMCLTTPVLVMFHNPWNTAMPIVMNVALAVFAAAASEIMITPIGGKR